MARSVKVFMHGVICLVVSMPTLGQDEPSPPIARAFDAQALDQAVDPCVDFYRYSCGGWHDANPRPADQSFWSKPFSQFSGGIDAFVRTLIERTASVEKRSAAEQKIGDFFAACMDLEAIEQRGLAPLRLELAPIDIMSSKEELGAALGTVHRALPWTPRDGEPLFWFDASPDPRQGGELMSLRIGPSGLGLPGPDYYAAPGDEAAQRLDRYRRHIERVFVLAGADDAAASRDAASVVRLEKALAAAYLPKSETRNNPFSVNHPMSIKDLGALTPHFDWGDFFRAQGLSAEITVNVREPEYLRALDRQLAVEPLDVWKAYLRWHLISERTKWLPAALREERFEFYGRFLRGLEQPTERARQCIQGLETHLPTFLGRVFTTHAFEPRMRRQAETLFEGIRDVMRERLRVAEWMASETREQALAKVDSVRLRVGHPENWPEDPLLVIRRDDAYGNARRAGEAMRRLGFSYLGGPVNLDWWELPVTWVGGFYQSQTNSIVVTAAMMLFYQDPPEDLASIYGGLGVLLAHELIHGFDPNGSSYDAAGRLRNWWTDEDSVRYDQRADCVARQFSEFEYAPGIAIDGSFVVSEQFSELSGMRLAWLAYLDAEPEGDVRREGLTARQRFFISMAQTWCADATEGEWRAKAAGGSSKAWAAPMVHGTVLNLPEFAESFGCRAGQPLVKPIEQVCQLW